MNIPKIEMMVSLAILGMQDRLGEVLQSYKDAKAAEEACPEIKAYDEYGYRQWYEDEYPNVNTTGHWLLRKWDGLMFHWETLQYIVTGRQCRAWQIEQMQDADDRLLSYAF